jgi:CrcB protein
MLPSVAMQVLLVALGGALGAAARYGLTLAAARLLPGHFPFGTFFVNAIGCAAFGAIVGTVEARGALTPASRAFWLAGVLGGFTTFSSYAWESFVLSRGGAVGLAALNVAGQVIVGLAAVALGWWAARSLA